MRPSQSSAEGHRSTAGNAVEPICLENLLALDTWFRAQIFPTEGAESGSPSHRCRPRAEGTTLRARRDRKSTRLNSSHVAISYAVFCLKKTNIASTVKSVQIEYSRNKTNARR